MKSLSMLVNMKLKWYIWRLGGKITKSRLEAVKNLSLLNDTRVVKPLLEFVAQSHGDGPETLAAIKVLEQFEPLPSNRDHYFEIFRRSQNNDKNRKRYAAIALRKLKVNTREVTDWLADPDKYDYYVSVAIDEFEKVFQRLSGANSHELIIWCVSMLYDTRVGKEAAKRLIALGDPFASGCIIEKDIINTKNAYAVLDAIRPSSDDALVEYCSSGLLRYGYKAFVDLGAKYGLQERILLRVLAQSPISYQSIKVELGPQTLQSLGASNEQIFNFYFGSVQCFSSDRYGNNLFNEIIEFLINFGNNRSILTLEKMLEAQHMYIAYLVRNQVSYPIDHYSGPLKSAINELRGKLESVQN